MSQKENIIILMCLNPYKWWYPYDFMRPDNGALYVGYKAPTRLSELSKSYPKMFDTAQDGKYKIRRVRWLYIDEWLPMLPLKYQKIINEEYVNAQKSY